MIYQITHEGPLSHLARAGDAGSCTPKTRFASPGSFAVLHG